MQNDVMVRFCQWLYCFTLIDDRNYFGQLRYARYASYKVFGFIWKSKTITREDSIDCSITPRERKNSADQKRKIEMADRKVVNRVFRIWPFFEFQAALFYSVYKCYGELSEKIWGHLEVIWPPRQTPFFLANSRKWNFSNILKTHHMIYQSTQNLMLISEMYRVIGLFWVFHILLRSWRLFFRCWSLKRPPFFKNFEKRAHLHL